MPMTQPSTPPGPAVPSTPGAVPTTPPGPATPSTPGAVPTTPPGPAVPSTPGAVTLHSTPLASTQVAGSASEVAAVPVITAPAIAVAAAPERSNFVITCDFTNMHVEYLIGHVLKQSKHRRGCKRTASAARRRRLNLLRQSRVEDAPRRSRRTTRAGATADARALPPRMRSRRAG